MESEIDFAEFLINNRCMLYTMKLPKGKAPVGLEYFYEEQYDLYILNFVRDILIEHSPHMIESVYTVVDRGFIVEFLGKEFYNVSV